MIAAMNGHFEIVQQLTAAGHDIDYKNKNGNTAILIAAQRGDVAGVETLLSLGADPRVVNRSRWNVADVAERFGHESITEVLNRF